MEAIAETKPETNSIRGFAVKYRLCLNDRKHERKYGITTTEDTIHGRYGEIVSDQSYEHVLAVKFIAVPRNANSNGALRNRYRKALDAGLRLKHKCGDAESTFHFDPESEQKSNLAIRLVGSKRRRTVNLSPEQKQALADRLARARDARITPALVTNPHQERAVQI
jgi:hypothetical protein